MYPGVAFSVLMQFFVNKGLVAAGVIVRFGVAYRSLSAIAVIAQVMMITLVFRLIRQHFAALPATAAVAPAE